MSLATLKVNCDLNHTFQTSTKFGNHLYEAGQKKDGRAARDDAGQKVDDERVEQKLALKKDGHKLHKEKTGQMMDEEQCGQTMGEKQAGQKVVE